MKKSLLLLALFLSVVILWLNAPADVFSQTDKQMEGPKPGSDVVSLAEDEGATGQMKKIDKAGDTI